MKQSMIHMQVIANQTGLPLSKVEAIMEQAVSYRLPPIQAGEDWPAGVTFGLLAALEVLGGDSNTVYNCCTVMLFEKKSAQ